jgi:putative endonuclease
MRHRIYFVYIAASDSRVLYVGVTNDLERRMAQHRLHAAAGFTARYQVNRLVYFETTDDVHSAIAREKQIKRWTRAKKVDLIERMNRYWVDLLVASQATC